MFCLLLFWFFIDLLFGCLFCLVLLSFVSCISLSLFFFFFLAFLSLLLLFCYLLACFFHGVFSLVHVVNDLLEFFIFKSAWERLERLYGPRSFDLMSLDINSQRVKVGQYLSQSTPCATSSLAVSTSLLNPIYIRLC